MVHQAHPATHGFTGNNKGDHPTPGSVGGSHTEVGNAPPRSLIREQMLNADLRAGVDEYLCTVKSRVERIDVGDFGVVAADQPEVDRNKPRLHVRRMVES